MNVTVRIPSKPLVERFYRAVGAPDNSNQLMYSDVRYARTPPAYTIVKMTLTNYHTGGIGDRQSDVVLKFLMTIIPCL